MNSVYRVIRQVAGVWFVLLVAAGQGAQAGQDVASRTSSFNQNWLNAIVSIEIDRGDGGQEPLGTGFFYETRRGNVVLVSSAHVLTPVAEELEAIRYVMHSESGELGVFAESTLQAAGLGTWFHATDRDLALRFFSWPVDFEGVYIPSSATIGQDLLQAGAPVLVLGFPLGLRDPEHGFPIVRSGNVAQPSGDDIVVDAFVFPGNSGGPVIYVPPIKVSGSLESPYINQERLIGVVSSFIPYREQAVSQKTGRPRVIFEENTGLANVLPIAEVENLLAQPAVNEADSRLSGLP